MYIHTFSNGLVVILLSFVFFSLWLCSCYTFICIHNLIIYIFSIFFFLPREFIFSLLKKKKKLYISFGRGPQLGDMVFSDTPRVRLDSGGRQFRRRWGYDGSGVVMGSAGGAGPGSLSNGGAGHLEDIEEDGDDFSDTYSLRDETLYNSILHEGKSHTHNTFKNFVFSQWEDVEEDCRLLSLCSGVTTLSIY